MRLGEAGWDYVVGYGYRDSQHIPDLLAQGKTLIALLHMPQGGWSVMELIGAIEDRPAL